MTALTALQRAILASLAEDLATSRPTAAEALQAALAACDGQAKVLWEGETKATRYHRLDGDRSVLPLKILPVPRGTHVAVVLAEETADHG